MEKEALYKLPCGLFILTAREGEKDNGCIVNTVMQVSANPCCIAVSVSKANLTHDMLLRTGKLNVSVLTRQAPFATYSHWGFQSGREVDKLESISYGRSKNGVVFLAENCNAVLCAQVLHTVDLGSHTLFVAEVEDAFSLSQEESVTYAYYHQNIKPKPVEKKKGYVCVICGYIYEDEPLPEDFVCPWCKHPASDFRPL